MRFNYPKNHYESQKNFFDVSWWNNLVSIFYELKERLFSKINTENLFKKNESIHIREKEAKTSFSIFNFIIRCIRNMR